MKVICPHCSGEASVEITGRNSYQTTRGTSAILRCPVVRERAEKSGGSTNDVDCEHLDNAAHQVVQSFRRKYG